MNDLITQFAKTDAVAQLLAVKPQDSIYVVDMEGDSTVTGRTAVAVRHSLQRAVAMTS
jgi:glucose-1-phosphate cytidylyltransferase